MSTYVLYGTMTFNNKSRRDSVASQMQTEAVNRGFTPTAWDKYGAGVVNTGNTTITFCYEHSDISVVEQTTIDLQTLLGSNQYDGDFGYQQV